jgi:uncharacterized SAM-binding protein YcdF (DUF218 family)
MGRTMTRLAAVLFLLLASLAGLSWWGVAALGRWLVVADLLERGDAIVVLNGQARTRAAEAAVIFRAGWAREVWLTRGADTAGEGSLGRPLYLVDEEESRGVLEHLGVPPSAIRVVFPNVRNTMEELQVVARELARTGGDRVILVTSKTHTRRTRATWQAVAGADRRAIVRYARGDPFDARRWWRQSEQVRTVGREVLGLLNVWTGFPIRLAPQTTG